MSVLTIVLVLLGGAIAGQDGLITAFVLALVLNIMAYWFSDRIAISMTRSRVLNENEAPQVYRALKELTNSAAMPMPRVYLMPSEQPNAFAAGRNPSNAVVAVTSGLLRILSYEELKGVLAHELAHIRNRDILISTIAAVMAGALVFISRIGMWGMAFGGGNRRSEGGAAVALIRMLALILAPLAAILIRMAISRTREYGADATGAQISGHPAGLASALAKMENYARRQPMAQLNDAASHMFIINPLSARGLSSLFSTHPPIRERIERLNRLEP